MEYCKYHPLSPATFSCNQCHTASCDHCVNEGAHPGKIRCFRCDMEVTSLGATNSAEPFWRRIQESFRYPINTQTLSLVLSVSLLSVLLSFVPFGFFIQLILLGIFIKYCFCCLENSAKGVLTAPDISEGYSGGTTLVIRLFLIIVALGVIVYQTYNILGQTAAGFLAFIFVAGFPAILINYALTESPLEALNPIRMLSLIFAIGLPYGVLLAFIFMMSASVGVINSFLGDGLSIISSALQSAVTNYYTIVLFHIMGYIIFQYQGQLGFTARANNGDDQHKRPDTERLAAGIEVALKEGDFDQVTALFKSALRQHPNDSMLNNQCFEFLYKTNNKKQLGLFVPHYFNFLIQHQRGSQLRSTYKRLLEIKPDYIPPAPDHRLAIAQACHEMSDARTVIKLLAGLHKEQPEYPHLVEAYEILADALEALPDMEDKAEKCRALIQHFKKQQQNLRPSTPAPKGPAVFNAKEAPRKQSNTNSGDLPPIDFV